MIKYKFTYCFLPFILLISFIFAAIFFSCSGGNNASNIGNNDTVKITAKTAAMHLLPEADTIIIVNKRKVIIRVVDEDKKKGTFLLLHGWNLPPEEWCAKTGICEKALENGYCLVLPDMGKSAYQSTVFTETRADWKNTPTRKWLSDSLILILQKEYSLLMPDDRNFIVGLSTGARGVALVILDSPNLFKGAAALSGDYNQSKIPHDNIMTGFYGAYSKFKKRWDTCDNPIYRIKEFQTPIYLGHGKLDKICTPEQTKLFYDSLLKYHPKLKICLNMPDAGHNYSYWDSEVDNIMRFFDEIK